MPNCFLAGKSCASLLYPPITGTQLTENHSLIIIAEIKIIIYAEANFQRRRCPKKVPAAFTKTSSADFGGQLKLTSIRDSGTGTGQPADNGEIIETACWFPMLLYILYIKLNVPTFWIIFWVF
jgi:hypothetical protein